ncbi:CHRD domain-containing protein [Allomeiothermus silvanus]|uniref:CHRD domain-containing protein n=1 Tax=Allomeiothermus silvanus TaxID=52022 RepID=UPI0023F3E926|nr:CHRD domain-containing protein [Allomeiothermus silvanus]
MNQYTRFGAVLAVVGVLALAQQAAKPQVRYATITGAGGIEGTAVIMTLPSGEHKVFVQVEGLKPGSGSYANHIHYNNKGDANCQAQNGDKLVGLANLVADGKGYAVAFTELPASVKYPSGTTYVNIHSNSLQPVGASIACGMVETK